MSQRILKNSDLSQLNSNNNLENQADLNSLTLGESYDRKENVKTMKKCYAVQAFALKSIDSILTFFPIQSVI